MERFYSFWIVTYHTNKAIIDDFVSNCFKYAYILHDKDDTDPHYHILCSFKQNKSFESVRQLFPSGQNTIVKRLVDKFGSYSYLSHQFEPDKFHYNPSDIVCNDLNYFVERTTNAIDNDAFISDLMPDSGLSYRDLAIKYGRDFIRNFKSYLAFAMMVYRQENNMSLFSLTDDKLIDDHVGINTIHFRSNNLDENT